MHMYMYNVSQHACTLYFHQKHVIKFIFIESMRNFKTFSMKINTANV